MNVEIKKAVRAGNSSAVILPRAWLDKEVRVELAEKTPEIILEETINIIKKYMNAEDIIGIYLTGSYARGEESKESDIDILVISADTDKEMIHDGVYNILIASEELLKWKLKNDLFPLGQMIKEAKPLINSKYLDAIEIKVTKRNVTWYIATTKEKLELIKKALDSAKKKAEDRIVYSLVLRIRTLCIIQKLLKNQNYSKKEFVRLIGKISGSGNAYEAYLSVKNDSGSSDKLKKATKGEAERLYVYLKKQLGDVKRLLN